jgi:hypothetical protein
MDLGLPSRMTKYYERFDKQLIDSKTGFCRKFAMKHVALKIRQLEAELN